MLMSATVVWLHVSTCSALAPVVLRAWHVTRSEVRHIPVQRCHSPIAWQVVHEAH